MAITLQFKVHWIRSRLRPKFCNCEQPLFRRRLTVWLVSSWRLVQWPPLEYWKYSLARRMSICHRRNAKQTFREWNVGQTWVTHGEIPRTIPNCEIFIEVPLSLRLSTRNTNISFKTRKTFFAFIAMPCATFTAFLCCYESGCKSLGMLSKDNLYGFCFLFVNERQKSNSCDGKASRNKSTKVGRGKAMEMITSHHRRRRLEELAVCSSFRWSSIKTSGISLWKLSCFPQSNKLLKVVVWDFGVVQLR